MAKSRYKVTPFARFLVFMIFFAPFAYLGAAYYNGEDGIQKIKELFNKEEQKEEVVDRGRLGIQDTKTPTNHDEDLLQLKDVEIKMLKEQILRLEQYIKDQDELIQSNR